MGGGEAGECVGALVSKARRSLTRYQRVSHINILRLHRSRFLFGTTFGLLFFHTRLPLCECRLHALSLARCKEKLRRRQWGRLPRVSKLLYWFLAVMLISRGPCCVISNGINLLGSRLARSPFWSWLARAIWYLSDIGAFF